MLCLLILSVLLVSSCQAGKTWYHPEDAEQHFEEFIVTYNKQYKDENERNMRFLIFKNNLMNINTKNSLGHDAEYGITKFTDLTKEEAKRFFHGMSHLDHPPTCGDSVNAGSADKFAKGDVPESLDWREKNKVTRVKDQGDCGSCWAFSTTGNVEGQHAIKHNELVELSEQQLVDCDTSDAGCGGGFMGKAIMWLNANGGSLSEKDYPYTAKNGTCTADSSKAVAKVWACTRYRVDQEEHLKKVLAVVGPLAIAIDAMPILDYKKGILTCPPNDEDINHGVLLVGYGKEGDKPYWLLKNSWAETYGEDGYFRLEMYKNSCNMLHYLVTAEVL